jgi:hypothetical protein
MLGALRPLASSAVLRQRATCLGYKPRSPGSEGYPDTDSYPQSGVIGRLHGVGLAPWWTGQTQEKTLLTVAGGFGLVYRGNDPAALSR